VFALITSGIFGMITKKIKAIPKLIFKEKTMEKKVEKKKVKKEFTFERLAGSEKVLDEEYNENDKSLSDIKEDNKEEELIGLS